MKTIQAWYSPSRQLIFTAVGAVRPAGKVRYYPMDAFYRDQDGKLPGDAVRLVASPPVEAGSGPRDEVIARAARAASIAWDNADEGPDEWLIVARAVLAAAQPAPESETLKLSVEPGTRCDQCNVPVRAIDYDGGHFRNEPCGHSGAHVTAQPAATTFPDSLPPRPWQARDSRVLDANGVELFLVHNVERWEQDLTARWLVHVINAARPAPSEPVAHEAAFGEEYWRGYSVGRCEERERLEPSEDDTAALTELIRNGLLEDDGIGAQYRRTDDGLPRDLARWIIDAGWRKAGVQEAAEAGAANYLIRLLDQTYTNEGVWTWLYSRNRNLGNKRPIKLLVQGYVADVLDAARRIDGDLRPAPDTGQLDPERSGKG